MTRVSKLFDKDLDNASRNKKRKGRSVVYKPKKKIADGSVAENKEYYKLYAGVKNAEEGKIERCKEAVKAAKKAVKKAATDEEKASAEHKLEITMAALSMLEKDEHKSASETQQVALKQSNAQDEAKKAVKKAAKTHQKAVARAKETGDKKHQKQAAKAELALKNAQAALDALKVKKSSISYEQYEDREGVMHVMETPSEIIKETYGTVEVEMLPDDLEEEEQVEVWSGAGLYESSVEVAPPFDAVGAIAPQCNKKRKKSEKQEFARNWSETEVSKRIQSWFMERSRTIEEVSEYAMSDFLGAVKTKDGRYILSKSFYSTLGATGVELNWVDGYLEVVGEDSSVKLKLEALKTEQCFLSLKALLTQKARATEVYPVCVYSSSEDEEWTPGIVEQSTPYSPEMPQLSEPVCIVEDNVWSNNAGGPDHHADYIDPPCTVVLHKRLTKSLPHRRVSYIKLGESRQIVNESATTGEVEVLRKWVSKGVEFNGTRFGPLTATQWKPYSQVVAERRARLLTPSSSPPTPTPTPTPPPTPTPRRSVLDIVLKEYR